MRKTKSASQDLRKVLRLIPSLGRIPDHVAEKGAPKSPAVPLGWNDEIRGLPWEVAEWIRMAASRGKDSRPWSLLIEGSQGSGKSALAGRIIAALVRAKAAGEMIEEHLFPPVAEAFGYVDGSELGALVAGSHSMPFESGSERRSSAARFMRAAQVLILDDLSIIGQFSPKVATDAYSLAADALAYRYNRQALTVVTTVSRVSLPGQLSSVVARLTEGMQVALSPDTRGLSAQEIATHNKRRDARQDKIARGTDS